MKGAVSSKPGVSVPRTRPRPVVDMLCWSRLLGEVAQFLLKDGSCLLSSPTPSLVLLTVKPILRSASCHPWTSAGKELEVSSSSHREASFEKCFMPSLEVTASVYPVAEQAGLDVRRERATVSVDGEMVV